MNQMPAFSKLLRTELGSLRYLTLPSGWMPHKAASSAQATKWAHCTSP